MKYYLKPLAEWFGHTRRERRASLILIALVVFVTAVRYVIPEKRVEFSDLSAMLAAAGMHEPEKDPAGSSMIPAGELKSPERPRSSTPVLVQERRIDLNSCDSSDLERLPGIGKVLSARIVKYRNLLGGYYTVNQLREVYGLKDSTFNLISAMVRADTSGIRRIKINSAGFRELDRHPYLERYDAQSILNYRDLKGLIISVSDLVSNKVLPPGKAEKIKPYLDFSNPAGIGR